MKITTDDIVRELLVRCGKERDFTQAPRSSHPYI